MRQTGGILRDIRRKHADAETTNPSSRLLDLGFSPTLTRLLGHLPKQRRTGLFSATMTDGLTELVRVGLRNPARVVVKVESKTRKPAVNGAIEAEIKERRTPATLTNMFMVCPKGRKMELLLKIIETERTREEGGSKFIVYMATCAAVDYFYRILKLLPQLSQYTVSSLHGHLPPSHRTSTLAAFTSHPSTTISPSLLLCTDVAARGLDLPDVDMVVQFDAPVDPKNFSHRAGRTARAGRKGRAVVLLEEGREEEYIGESCRLLRVTTCLAYVYYFLDFLAVRKIPLRPHPALPDPSTTSATPIPFPLLPHLRDVLLTDRDLHDRSLKAFVSFLRAYSKHEASYIFRLKDLDLGGVAENFGLLRMPGGPEVKEWRKRVEKEREAREKAKMKVKDAAEGEMAEKEVMEEEEAVVAEEERVWKDAEVDVSGRTSSLCADQIADRSAALSGPRSPTLRSLVRPSGKRPLLSLRRRTRRRRSGTTRRRRSRQQRRPRGPTSSHSRRRRKLGGRGRTSRSER